MVVFPPCKHLLYISKSALGRNLSVGQHLCYKFKLNQLGDDQYISHKDYETGILNIDPRKKERINEYINNDQNHQNVFQVV